jgi:hypothetical protein
VEKMTCEACNIIPPVLAEGYIEKGKWEEVSGLRACLYFPFPLLFLSILLEQINPANRTKT